MTFYKTIRPDGGSFHDPDFKYVVGKTVRRRTTGTPELCTDTVLHAARTAPLAARYSQWPYQLIEVAGIPVVDDGEKAGFKQLTVVGEGDVAECFGPNGAKVLAIVRRCEALTAGEASGLVAAQGAAWDAAWDAARDAARVAVVADLIGKYGYTQEHHDLLMKPWTDVIGVWDGTKWVNQ